MRDNKETMTEGACGEAFDFWCVPQQSCGIILGNMQAPAERNTSTQDGVNARTQLRLGDGRWTVAKDTYATKPHARQFMQPAHTSASDHNRHQRATCRHTLPTPPTRVDANSAASTKTLKCSQTPWHVSDWMDSTSPTSWTVSESVPVSQVILRCTSHQPGG